MAESSSWQRLREDRAVYLAHLEMQSASWLRRVFTLYVRSTFLVVVLFRLTGTRVPIVRQAALVGYKLARILSGIQIPRGTDIGGGLLLPHHGTIVINRKAKIGPECIILHNVTIGAKGRGADYGVPVIGAGVYMGAGAVVLGSIEIGDGAILGANSVVTRSVAPGAIVVGNPARPLSGSRPGGSE